MFSSKNLISISAFGLILLTSITTAAPSIAVCNCEGGEGSCTGPWVCVRFDNLDDPPETPTHFTFSFDETTHLPTVTLVKGGNGTTTYEWRVWSEVSDSDDTPADIALIEGLNAEDYDVSILDDQTPTAGPGAVNVGGINLDPSSEFNYSRIDDGHITGDLTGVTFLQERTFPPPFDEDDETPTFGDIKNLIVDGSVIGNVTANVIQVLTIGIDLSGILTTEFIYDYFTVNGNISGDVVVDLIKDGYELEVVGNLLGSITINKFEFGAIVEILGDVSGAIVILQGVESNGVTDAVVQIGKLTGSLTINGDLEGLVDINGYSSGTIDVGGITSGTIDILSHCTGPITLVGEVSGDIIVGGTLNDQIVISDNLTSTGSITVGGDTRSDIVISLDCAGDIILNGHLLGDVDIAQDLTADGSIVIDDSMKSTGRILVGGLIHGLVSVGTETLALSQIRAVGGLALNACIIINADEGAYDANGVIHLGPTFPIPVPPPPIQNDVTFDGGIKIFDESSSGAAGNLEGTITVTGCHLNPPDLDICVDGSINGTITINQTDCDEEVTYSCVGACPP